MKKYGLYLFDFDGTLFDSLPSSIMVFKEAYRRIGMEISDEQVLEFTREPIPVSYKKMGAPIEKFQEFGQSIFELVTSKASTRLTEIFDDTFETIIDLYSEDATLGIVTSNGIPHVKEVLKKYNLHCGIFTVLVGNDEAPIPKPDPSPILKALEMAGPEIEKSSVIYVGDAINDCIAAERAGIDFVLLDRNNEYSNSGYPIIHSLKELL